jgi:hypothetical protein
MKKPETIVEKVLTNTLRSSDMPLFIKMLEQDIRNGDAKASKDDIKWFEIYTFLLEKLELMEAGEPSDMRAGDWRLKVHDYGKLRSIMTEMEDDNLVENTFWNVEGIVLFDIVNQKYYREYLFCKIRNHICRIYEHFP